jgi:TonB family protein
MKIDIKQPCSADWEAMKIGVTSRNCEQCKKAVVDFTQMDRLAIITYLIDHSDKSVCGRIKASSIDFYETDLPILIDALRTRNSNLAFTFLAAACLSLSACSETPSPKKVQIELQSPLKSVISSTGKPTKKNISKDTEKNKEKKQQIVTVVHPEIMGEISILPEPMPIVEPVDPPNEPNVALPLIESEKDSVYTILSKSPEFPGGMDAMFKFIQNNLVYPDYEKESGIEGTVYLEFIVRKTGEIDNIKLLRGIKGGLQLDKEAIRIVKNMPKWIPGLLEGRNVSSVMRLPIKFRLD